MDGLDVLNLEDAVLVLHELSQEIENLHEA